MFLKILPYQTCVQNCFKYSFVSKTSFNLMYCPWDYIISFTSYDILTTKYLTFVVRASLKNLKICEFLNTIMFEQLFWQIYGIEVIKIKDWVKETSLVTSEHICSIFIPWAGICLRLCLNMTKRLFEGKMMLMNCQ